MLRLFLYVLVVATPLIGNVQETSPSIPVLDMHDFYNPKKRAQFIQNLSAALQDVGSFVLTNSEINPETLNKTYEVTEEFFDLEKEVKFSYYAPYTNMQRGYCPSESPKGRVRKDFKEFYHIGQNYTEEERKAFTPQPYPNVWPKEVDLQKPLVNLFNEYKREMVPIEQAMALAIGRPPNFFSTMTKDGDNVLRIGYFPANCPKKDIWAAGRTNVALFAICPKATAPGLQLMNKSGEWIPVYVPQNALVIIAGDKLQNITNGFFRSGQLRVVDPGLGKKRYSTVFFVHPRFEDDMSPLPDCIARTGGKQKYPNATSLELLEERLADLGLASDEMLQHLAKSGLIERTIELGTASSDAIRALVGAGLSSEVMIKELEKIQPTATEKNASP